VSADRSPAAERVRTAEVIGSLCLATDLGMGFPFEHGLQTTIIAMRLADRLGLDRKTCADTYYASLLSHAGCTTEVHVSAEIFGGSLTEHLNPVMRGSLPETLRGLLRALPEPGASGIIAAAQAARRLPRAARGLQPSLNATCEVAGMLAEHTGAPTSVRGMLAYLTDRWDGRGPLRRGRGEGIPLPMRIVHVAEDAALHRVLGGVDHAVGLIRERSGHAFDPAITACLVGAGSGMLHFEDGGSVWDEAMSMEPDPPRTLSGDAVEKALGAMGNFADLVSPFLSGHSAGVARLASTAAGRLGLDSTVVRRAGLVHDLGRVAVGARIWQKTEPLSADEWEKVRLHPYHTERVLSRAPVLAGLAPLASSHHERLDRTGYHRGAGPELPMEARLIAAADTFHSMCEPRPHRTALHPEKAAWALAEEANGGRLHPDAVAAVVEAAGIPAPPLERPEGLTEREVEVLGMLARGLATKQVAHALGISAKTADHHIQHVYAKIGVTSRAAATIYAMEKGLVGWARPPKAG
jgi:HD-GYP domain-containing protein (c-di-GMP phosphodiesterase class II)